MKVTPLSPRVIACPNTYNFDCLNSAEFGPNEDHVVGVSACTPPPVSNASW